MMVCSGQEGERQQAAEEAAKVAALAAANTSGSGIRLRMNLASNIA